MARAEQGGLHQRDAQFRAGCAGARVVSVALFFEDSRDLGPGSSFLSDSGGVPRSGPRTRISEIWA